MLSYSVLQNYEALSPQLVTDTVNKSALSLGSNNLIYIMNCISGVVLRTTASISASCLYILGTRIKQIHFFRLFSECLLNYAMDL